MKDKTKRFTVGSYRVYNTRTPVYTRKSEWGSQEDVLLGVKSATPNSLRSSELIPGPVHL